MSGELRSVLAVFDIIVNDAALEASNKKLDTFVDKLKGIGAAFASFGIVKGVLSFGEHVAEAAREAEFGAQRIGMTAPEYQKLAQVAENYGMKVEQLQIASRLFIRNLSDQGGVMGEFGGHSKIAAAALHNLGINAAQFKGKGLQDILPVLADRFKAIPDPLERTAIALRLFGHRGLSILPMMAAGGEELRRQFAAAIPVFEELTITSANNATIAGKQLGRTWDNLVDNSFGRAALDVFTVVATKLTDILLVVKDLTKYSEIGKGVLVALGVALSVAGGIAVAAWWPVLVPILAVLAAFVALALAVDDFIVFMEGGDSLIADFFDELLGPGGAEKAQKFIKDIWDDFKGFLDELKKQAVPEFLHRLKEELEQILEIVHGIRSGWGAIRGFADKIAQKTGLTDENITNTAKGAWDAVTGYFGPPAANLAATFTGSTAPAPTVSASSFSMIPRDDQGTVAPGSSFTINGGIDSGELAHKVKRVVDDHNDAKLDRILRDAFAGAGGAR